MRVKIDNYFSNTKGYNANPKTREHHSILRLISSLIGYQLLYILIKEMNISYIRVIFNKKNGQFRP